MTVNMTDFDAYWKQVQELNKNTPNLGGKFEDLMFSFIQECFGKTFGIYKDKIHYNNSAQNLFGIKCLNGKTPDIVITSEDTRNLPSIVNIGIEKIKMLIELNSVAKYRKAKKIWKNDVLKYKQIRSLLHNNNVSLATFSLFTITPSMLNAYGNSCFSSDELLVNRMTFAAFLKPLNPRHHPWWYWVSKVPTTKSMEIPADNGILRSPEYNASLSGKNPLSEIYNVLHEILNPVGYIHFQKIPKENLPRINKDYEPSDWNFSAPVSTITGNPYEGHSLGEQLKVESEVWDITKNICGIRKRKS